MEIFVIHDGTRLGPFSVEDVEMQFASGKLSPADYAWTDGLDDWKPLADVLPTKGLSRNQTAQKPKRIGIIRRALRAVRAFIERCLTPTAVIGATVLLLLGSWIYPPGFYSREYSHGWFFLFDMKSRMRVDFGRLLLLNAIIAAVGGLLAWTFYRNSTGRRAVVRIVFYTLLVAPLVAVICLSIVLIQNIKREVVAAKTRSFDPASGTLELSDYDVGLRVAPQWKAHPYDALITYLAKQHPTTVKIPGYGIAEFPAAMSADEIAAVINKKFFSEPWKEFDPKVLGATPVESDKAKDVVGPTNLQNIILFDVGTSPSGYSWISGFHGRIKNGLPGAIHRIGIQASFYNSAGELIEVRTFWLRHWTGSAWEEQILPNTPVSFESSVPVEHLPQGWKYQLQVIEARYVSNPYDALFDYLLKAPSKQ